MKTYYGVYRVTTDNQSDWLFVGTEAECVGACKEGQFVRELIGDADEVWAIRAQVARDRGEAEPVLFEDDELIGPDHGVDRELAVDEYSEVFEEYIHVTKELANHDAKYWDNYRYARQAWWSVFKMEMDTNWLPLDVYDRKLDLWLFRKKDVSDAAWNEAMKRRSVYVKECEKRQQKRKNYTYGIYLKAKEATERCKAFWASSEGKRRTELSKQRANLWNFIRSLPITFEDYNNTISMELNPYFTSGETEEVDDMTLSLPTQREMLDMLEDSHMEEMHAMERAASSSIGYWDWKQTNSPVYYVNASHHSVVGRYGLMKQDNGAPQDTYLPEDWDNLMEEFSNWE